MKHLKHKFSIFDHFVRFHKSIVRRIVWPHTIERDSLAVWRAVILSSTLIAGIVFGIFALVPSTFLIVRENAWGLAVVDFSGLVLCLVFLFVHRIRFEVRLSITLFMFYAIGVAVILSVGPLSGGPAWLFAFAVLAGVLMGNGAAFIAIAMNAVFISTMGMLISTGKFGSEFPFFNSRPAMITAGINFIVLNAITAVSVASLVKGLFRIYKRKEELARHLDRERAQLVRAKQSLESEIKDRKQAQVEKLKAFSDAAEAKKMALIGEVAGKMAHDFNNILGIIMGTSELSLMDCKDETMGRNLTLILNQTLRGKNLTRNLVAFAKSQEPKQKYFRINEKIDLVLNLMKKDLEAIDVRVEHGPAIPDLLADPGMIEHALVNLVQNAIHAVGRIKDPVIIVRTYCRENHIWCEIRDNGCGIPSQYLKAIFEPSFTLKGSRDVIGAYKSGVKGSGYGMANTKKYIDQHNGTIRVESLVDSGTQFTISLPIIHRELSVQEKNQLENQPHFFEKQILLVEDEPAISEVQYRILTQEPCRHRVDLADNGQAAMALLDKNRYDLISLDYVLPGGVNGMDVYRHIRKTNKRIPILFVSGNIEFLESIQGLMNEDPHLDHLSKPCKNMDYINGLNRLMNETRD